MRSVPKYHHSYALFLLGFVVLILFHPAFSINVNVLSPTESLTISGNRTIVSPGDVFELGFFKPGTSSLWYLGIWYKTMQEGAYVWVANRDTPLNSPIGTLKIHDANLVLLDHSDLPVWSTKLTKGDGKYPVLAELLPNGNFVLRYSNNESGRILWQSFDFPTDTLLPQMNIGWDAKTGLNKFLRSWRSPDNPSSGYFSYKLEIRKFSEFFLLNRDAPVYRSGPWDGIRFNGMPEMLERDYMIYNFTENRKRVAYTFLMTNQNIYSRLTLTPQGILQQFTWNPTEPGQSLFWSSPKDQCDGFEICGPNSYCDIFQPLMCNCIRGFEPEAMARDDGSIWCVRKTRLSCGEDGFTLLRNMKLPDTTAASVERKISLKECEDMCRKNCNCTAFANMDVRNGGSGCVIWTGVLNDIRKHATAGQDLYVKLAASDLEDERSGDERNNINRKVVGLIIGVSVIILLGFIIFCFWKRKQKRAKAIAAHMVHQERNQNLLMNGVVLLSGRHLAEENLTEDLELPLMDFDSVIMATDNFSNSNMLGRGGFGFVYKGRLRDGKEIAVKRLSAVSSQGINEFMNEVRLIAKLQHKNLVRLLGCCVYADEKILIYEFMENLSLDSYLFDQTRSSKLNWQKRFDITNGIARGLLYLHQDSRCRIIHRDLKASNVLLDKDMTPKISDFGMARIFATDETEASTVRIVGTYGYMSPEYAMNGIFSVKSDVFSFGVLVLEIISGKRNRGSHNSDHYNNLLGYVWKNWKEGKGLEIVDPIIINSSASSPSSTFQPHEILRCIQIGLLCVQERAEDRPTMSSVVFMLGSETTAIPQPRPPSYYIETTAIPLETDSSLLSTQPDEESWTTNQITISVIDPR